MKLKSNFLSIFAVFALSMAATSAWADEVELSQEDEYRYSATMPQEGENTITVPADAKIIRIGTNNGWLTNSSVTLTAPEGKILQVIEGDYGSLSTEYYNGFSGQDSLFIYNGANASAPEIFKAARGAALGTLSTTGPNLTIYYKESKEKDWWYSNFRLDLIVFVVDPNATHNIVVDEDASSNGTVVVESPAKANTLVQLTATPNAGYVLEGFIVRTTDEWYSIPTTENALFAGNEATFIMPGTNVTVEPIFVSAAALESGLTLNTPSGRALRVNIPSGVESFKINGGGMDNELTKPMILKAPDGYLFYLEDGSAQYSDRTGIFAYDGDNEDAYRTIKEPMKGNYSVGSELTLVYVSIGDQYSQTIRLIEANATHSVDVSYDGNGFAGGGLSSASVGNTIDLTAEPGEGYMIGSIYAEADGWWPVPITGGTWYTSNDYSFTMPYADVEVYVKFVEKVTTADDGLYIEMPQRDSVVATIPADVESFNVTGKCDWETCRGTLVLAAPEGFRFQLSGSVGIGGEYASVTIFDGSIANALHQLDLNQNLNIELNSSGDTLTLRNQARNSFVWINLLVTMFNPNKKYNVIAYNEIENGKISVDKESAGASETVTLTAIPDDGFVLKAVHVTWKDDNEEFHEVTVNGGTWYNNEAKFVMPFADVYYMPEFVKPGDVNYDIVLPKNGALNLEIPEGVSSLNIFVDADDNNKYYDNSDGTLTLTAPEGYVFNVFGEVYTNDAADSLTVFDGNSISAKKLLNVSEDDIDVYSSSRSITLRFKSNESGHNTGFALEVWVGSKSSTSAIALSEFDDGDWIFARIDGNYAGKDAVNIPEAIEVNAIEFVREFTPDLPATVVLPFSLPEGASVNAKFYQLESVEQEGRSWVANMRKIGKNTTPKANTPYVIIPEDSELQFEFSGTATLRTEKIEMTWSSDGNWYFTGAYVYRPWVENDEVLGLAYAFAGSNEDEVATGDFGRMGEGSYIVPMRAYLSKANSSIMLDPSRFGRPQTLSEMSSTELPENIDVKFMDEDDKVMAIGRMNTVTGEFKIDRWYDLKGRRTNNKPTTKGAFFNKRVIVK